MESAVDAMRREREERRSRLKRRREEEQQEAGTNEDSAVRLAPQLRETSNEKSILGPAPQFRETNNENSVMRPAPQLRATREMSRTGGLNLPEGWLDCPNMGEPIMDLFIPSKVPLGDRFNEVIPLGKRFSMTHLLRQHREVALVIDLTNTTRYYSPQECSAEGVNHVKVQCRGRDEVPEPEAVNLFVHEAMKFRESVELKVKEKRYVLVHCTHGHNRTGFMIVHFLVRTEQMSVEKAIRLFAEARPPGIYKVDYINSLYKFYHERRPEPFCPPTPEWKRRTGFDLNEETRGHDDDGGILGFGDRFRDKEQSAAGLPITKTNDDVLGHSIPDDEQRDMQMYILDALGVNSKGHPKFPGSQPVSLSREKLQLLRQRYYYATWKADGTRYMLFLTRTGCYLIDRNFRFRRVQLRFPRPFKTWKDSNSPVFHHLTLLDGEMVIDTLKGVQFRTYLAYDLMILNGRPCTERPFKERWKLINDEVHDPRSEEKTRGGRYNYEAEQLDNFSVKRKGFWMLSTTEKLLNPEFIGNLTHETDGLIFQGWEDLYVPRTHEGLLKWKHAWMNSVDFQLEVSSTRQYLLLLMERGGRLKILDGAEVKFPAGGEDPSTMVGKVIECSWNPEESRWEFMRIRKDKETPNAYHVYEKVLGSLHDNITEEDLLKEIKEICTLPMYAEKIARTQREQQQRASRAGR